MNKLASSHVITAGLVMALFASTSGVAETLPIVNPSFEMTNRPLAPGEQSNGVGGAGIQVGTRFPFGGGPAGVSWEHPVEIPGWRTHTPPQGSQSIAHAGVLNPPMLAGQPFITQQHGQYVLSMQAAKVGQALPVLVQARTRYRLEFRGGIGLFGTQYILSAGLIAVPSLQTMPLIGEAGVVQLAITQGLVPPLETHGTMRQYSIEYTTPTVLPPELAGKFIGVHLFGSDGLPRVLYDDFRLTATLLEAPPKSMPQAEGDVVEGASAPPWSQAMLPSKQKTPHFTGFLSGDTRT